MELRGIGRAALLIAAAVWAVGSSGCSKKAEPALETPGALTDASGGDAQANNVEGVRTWECGDSGGNVIATMKDDMTLAVSGTGNMADYSSNTYFSHKMVPWPDIKDSITDVVIEEGVTSIGNYAFREFIYLKSVAIPNSVKRIGESAFLNCSSMTSITIPNSVRHIGMQAFAISGLTSVVIPDSVTHILSAAFTCCKKMTSVTFHNRVECILDFAFAGCTSLTSITIPNSVYDIGAYAFDGCVNLMSIIIPNRRSPPRIDCLGSFGDSDDDDADFANHKLYFKKACLYVPADRIAVYRADKGWNQFKCIKPIESAPTGGKR